MSPLTPLESMAVSDDDFLNGIKLEKKLRSSKNSSSNKFRPINSSNLISSKGPALHVSFIGLHVSSRIIF